MYTHSMKTIIHKWGNSLGLRIPKAFAVHLGIGLGEEVELSMDKNGLRIVPSSENLERLLSQVTPRNLHRETGTGKLRGREVW